MHSEDLEPRKLSEKEVISSAIVPLKQLLSPNSVLNMDIIDGRPPSDNLIRLPDGTNTQADSSDSIRLDSKDPV